MGWRDIDIRKKPTGEKRRSYAVHHYALTPSPALCLTANITDRYAN